MRYQLTCSLVFPASIPIDTDFCVATTTTTTNDRLPKHFRPQVPRAETLSNERVRDNISVRMRTCVGASTGRL